jgi:hypothetical protein
MTPKGWWFAAAGLALVTAGVLGGLGLLSGSETSRHPVQHRADPTGAAATTGADIGSRFRSLLQSPAVSTPASPSEAMRQELITSTTWLPLYERLISLPVDSLQAHEAFYLAYMLETCLALPGTLGTPPSLAMAGRSGIGPDRRSAEARARLENRSVGRLCQGIPVDTDTETLIADLYAQAAERGDLRAQAWVLGQQLQDAGSDLPLPDGNRVRLPSRPDEDQLAALREILATGDPMAIAYAGRLLTRGARDFGVAFGPEQVVPSMRLEEVMWDLAACQFGANCSGSALQLDLACATQGICDASSYADYLYRHVLSQQDIIDFMRIYPYLMAALRNGDWSGIHFLDHNPNRVIGSGRVRWWLGG